MLVSHAYLLGTIGLAIVFTLLCMVRKDLRRVMLYAGFVYLFYMTAVFLLSRILSSDPAKSITPGYWGPPSLWDLNKKTGGLGIEDTLYMFFVGAIAAGLYDTVFKIKLSKKPNKKLKKGHALLFALVTGSLVFVFTPVNAVYLFIFIQLFGAAAIVWQRRDLLTHVLLGGLFFMVLYAVLFLIFKLLFPHFLSNYYHLDRTSHLWLLGIPLEEYLYSFTLGMMWAPLYEYEYRVKDRKNKGRNLAPRRLSPAAANSRR